MPDPQLPPNNPFEPGPLRLNTYAPGQSPALMNDPMGLVISMFGVPMLQNLAGPGKFLPQLTPGQQLADQMMAKLAQQNALAATASVTAANTAAVDNRILGLMSMLTGTPAQELNKADANYYASMLNHPVAKMMIGQQIGPENLEALMFGRKGDPAAMAATIGRLGFFRRDTLGGERMSAESMADFTQSLYHELYGTEKNTNEMHGFMAGQTAQLYENLFQRGVLPQSIGALSAADRVKAIADDARPRDAETMKRLAREYATRDLTDSTRMFTVGEGADRTDKRFSELTAEQKEQVLKENEDYYVQMLQKTLDRVTQFKRNDGRTQSASEIEKLDGYGVLARQVDAGKTADTLKEYAGAVAAIREIFGDNGNPNAPMPQLLAALEHLGRGSITQVGATHVENTLRSMRLAARDAGIGFEQMAGMHAQIGAYADTLGLEQPTALQATQNAMIIARNLRTNGDYSKPVFGRADSATVAQEAAMNMLNGANSSVGQALQGIVGLYKSNKAKYQGTGLEQLVNAYENNQQTFDVTMPDGSKQTFDLANIAGKQRVPGLENLAHQFGVTSEQFYAAMNNPMYQQHQNAMYNFLPQRGEITQTMYAHGVEGALAARFLPMVESDEFKKALNNNNVTFTEDQRATFMANLGSAMAERMLSTEYANLSQAERIDLLQSELPQLVAAAVGGPDAGTIASVIMGQGNFFGQTEGDRRAALQVLDNQVEAVMRQTYGASLATQAEKYDKGNFQAAVDRQIEYDAKARRFKQMQAGHESSFIQRFGEYVAQVGEGKAFDFEGLSAYVTDVMSVTDSVYAAAPEMKAALVAATKAAGEAEAAVAKDPKNADLVNKAEAYSKVFGAYIDGKNVKDRQAAAQNLADIHAKELGFNPDLLKAEYEKIAAGDEKALSGLEARIGADRFAVVKGLYLTQQLADKEHTTLGELLPLFDKRTAIRDAQDKEEEQKKIEKELREARENRNKTPAQRWNETTKAWGDTAYSYAMDAAVGFTAVSNWMQGGVDGAVATMSAATVQLTADSVTISSSGVAQQPANVSLKQEELPRGGREGATDIQLVAQQSAGGPKEINFNGEIVLKNLREGILSAIGRPPIHVQNGPSVRAT